MTYPTFAALEHGYARLWAGLQPMPAHMPALKTICEQLLAHKATYCEIAQTVWGKPDSWFVVALLDAMEHDPELGLCNSHLHNGDSLARRTVHVPAGRPPAPATPPFSFAESAIDLLRYQGFDQVAAWTPERLAYWLERDNGEGYLSRPGENPYLVAWSGEETPGKYTSDHHYDPHARSGQPGALTILKVLITMDPTVAAALAPAQPQEPTTMSTMTAVVLANPNIFQRAEDVLTKLQQAEPWLEKVLPLIPGVGAQVALILHVLDGFEPAVEAALKDLAAANGGNVMQAVIDFINHITPGQPNAPALSPSAPPVLSTQNG